MICQVCQNLNFCSLKYIIKKIQIDTSSEKEKIKIRVKINDIQIRKIIGEINKTKCKL